MANTENIIYQEKVTNGKIFARICKSAELFEGKGKRFVFPEDIDMQVAIFRKDGKLFALSNICPHRHQDKIYEGILKNGNVTCPAHGWTYNLATGENVDLRQGIKSLIKYDSFEEDGYIWVEKPDKDVIPAWRRDTAE